MLVGRPRNNFNNQPAAWSVVGSQGLQSMLSSLEAQIGGLHRQGCTCVPRPVDCVCHGVHPSFLWRFFSAFSHFFSPLEASCGLCGACFNRSGSFQGRKIASTRAAKLQRAAGSSDSISALAVHCRTSAGSHFDEFEKMYVNKNVKSRSCPKKAPFRST